MKAPVDRSYDEHMPNGVVSTVTFADDEIRYSVTKDGSILYNQAIVGKYSFRLAARFAREQYEVATKAARLTKACCNGNDPACPTHGVAASNARQNERMR